MKTTTFEIPLPVKDTMPQWIGFIHEVNRLAKAAHEPKPFLNPIKEIDRGHRVGDDGEEYVSDIGIEVYPEALVIHTKKAEDTIGVTRFEPQSSRVFALMAKAAEKFDEANVTTPEPADIGAYYTRQRAKIEALEILLDYIYDQGEVTRLHRKRVERNLEKARVID